MKRKFLCLLLALCMVLGLAAPAFAEEGRITSGDWTYRLVEGKAVILDYNGTDAHVVVPAELDGYAVSEIGDAFLVFSDAAETMTSITVSEGVEIINPRAFMNCTALQKVVLPGTVRYIGSSAFEGCTSLSDVTLSEGLETIHRYAFLNTALTSIFIPASVTELDEDSVGYTGEWGDTSRVKDFTIYGYTGTSAEWYAEYWNFNFVDMGANYDNSGRCGDSARWEYTAATGTLRIYGSGYMADYDNAEEFPWFVHMPFITRVVVEDVLNISYYAFQGYTNLTTVTMDDTVNRIEGLAFKDTPKLTNVTLSANLESIGTEAFLNSGLTRIYLPEGLRSIGTFAFSGTPLTSIDIPDSVELSQGAFYYCTELASVKLPAKLEEIISLLFQGCTSLKSIDLPESLRIIGRQAFSLSGLTAIEIPDGVTVIGENAFYECMDLEYVKLPASLEETGWRCFQDCDKLSTIVMPEGIDPDFTQCCFLSCDSLTDIDFHTAPTIGYAMYQNCDGLTNLVIPDCVTSIGMQAFAFCDNLIYATVPASVTTFDAKVFYECPKLGAIAFRGDAPAFHEFAFEDTTVTCYYPADNATWTEEVRQSYNGEVTWIPYEVLPFTDVPVNTFYYAPVDWAVDNGITNGATATAFDPNGQCQRGQIVTFLWRAAGCPVVEAENPFTDVKETDFYYDAVLWAVDQGITNGTTATTFSPFKVCTRAEVVTFLWRVNGSLKVETTEQFFADVNSGDFFYHAAQWAYAAGIANGIDSTHFAPYSVCNRAQVVTFLYRAYNK